MTNMVVGLTDRAEIERVVPAWTAAIDAAAVDRGAWTELLAVPPGASIDVFLGTWCGDSRREVSRFFRGLEGQESLPFTVRFIAVDREKHAPPFTDEPGVSLRYVPTFIVRRDGVEVGRVVESAPRGIERELVELLAGRSTGTISLTRPAE